MIKELRKKFIGIAMISVTVVMVLFAAAVNVANYVSVRSELNQMLDLIAGNQGVIPSSPPGGMPEANRQAPSIRRPLMPPGISFCAIPTMGIWFRRT